MRRFLQKTTPYAFAQAQKPGPGATPLEPHDTAHPRCPPIADNQHAQQDMTHTHRRPIPFPATAPTDRPHHTPPTALRLPPDLPCSQAPPLAGAGGANRLPATSAKRRTHHRRELQHIDYLSIIHSTREPFFCASGFVMSGTICFSGVSVKAVSRI